MSVYKGRKMDISDAFWNFLNEKMSSESISYFLNAVYMCQYDVPMEARSATNLLLIQGPDYAFSSDDLDWLTNASEAYLCKTQDGINVLAFELKCKVEDYYVVCAAIIKVFSKVFCDNIMYLFRIDSSIAFGCKREFQWDIDGNFCVTQLFNVGGAYSAISFLTELSLLNCDDMPWVIINYSPQEQEDYVTNIQKRDVDLDYIRFLNDFASSYGVDMTRECQRYMESLEESVSYKTTYKEAVVLLRNIAMGTEISSYDVMEAATEAQEKYEQLQIEFIESDSQHYSDSEEYSVYSEEAFLNADIMLEEMLKFDNE